MHAIEKKRRVQQLAESVLSPRKVLRLHASGERNIDSVESEFQKPRLPKMRQQRRVKGLSAWSPLMLSAALAAATEPPKTKSQPATKEFIINLDDSSNSEEASEEE